MTKIGPRAQKVFDEVGYNISQEAKDLISSIDGTFKRITFKPETGNDDRVKQLEEEVEAYRREIAELKAELKALHDAPVAPDILEEQHSQLEDVEDAEDD